MAAGLDRSEGGWALSFCRVVRWVFYDGEQFVRGPPAPHWLKCFQILANDGSSLVDSFSWPCWHLWHWCQLSHRHQKKLKSWRHSLSQTGRSPASCRIRWNILASSGFAHSLLHVRSQPHANMSLAWKLLTESGVTKFAKVNNGGTLTKNSQQT